jgi:transposase-like protein
MARKGYPVEFRRRALDLVAAGKTVAEVARLLEVSDQSIYSWRRQELIDRGELPGLSSAEREELRPRGCGSGSSRPSWRESRAPRLERRDLSRPSVSGRSLFWKRLQCLCSA